ncbi:MAG: hypothetical protein Gaeavirus2_16 [Gaeavirus sp.]|uniref:Peptidase S74 domain-containing protein n=1 Tax=Gaeavirus sp. TaxID=2487767 RepID=A0A3G5A094_9VIRU|nr:MAG: hypothetical protein Gaeavirus2_16 [Gaeavirus sp.]
MSNINANKIKSKIINTESINSFDANSRNLVTNSLDANIINSNTTNTTNLTINGLNEIYYSDTGNILITDSVLPNNGSLNTIIGIDSFIVNTSGNYNVVYGSGALEANSTGSSNVAIGVTALQQNTTGDRNIGIGQSAMFSNTTGSDNIAIGFNLLGNNTIGSNNLAMGSSAGINEIRSNNTYLGYNSGPISIPSTTSGGNNTCLGANAKTSISNANNEITLGDSNIETLRCNAPLTTLSDIRDKEDIEPLDLGIEFINQLKPCKFKWDKREWYEGGIKDGSKKSNIQTAGFIAQDLKQTQEDNNASYLRLVYDANKNKLEATPSNLIPIIIKSIQELSEKVRILAVENEELRNEIAILKK